MGGHLSKEVGYSTRGSMNVQLHEITEGFTPGPTDMKTSKVFVISADPELIQSDLRVTCPLAMDFSHSSNDVLLWIPTDECHL